MPESEDPGLACANGSRSAIRDARPRTGQVIGLYFIVMNLLRIPVRVITLLALLAVSGSLYAQAVPSINQCRGAWVVTTTQDMNFGAFSAEGGSASITMNSLGGLTPTGLVNLSTTIPATTWTFNVDNTLGPACASYGFSLELQRAPRPLAGPGASIPLGNLRLSIPAYGLADVGFPQVIAPGPGNTIPFSVTVYGEITVTGPQTAGEYSVGLVALLFQSVRRHRVTTTVRATSIVPLSIAEVAPMDFGTVAGGPVPGSVILGTAGGRITSGDVQALPSGPGSAATFQITGDPGNAYSLSYGNGTLASPGGQQMTVTTFTDNSAGTIPAAGTATFQVGATLNVGSNQPAGLYSTSTGGGSPYTVTINYN